MPCDVTNNWIIEEYLNNWFTYEELAQYLCITVDRVRSVLEDQELVSKLYGYKKFLKIGEHTLNIRLYYSNPTESKEVSSLDRRVKEIAEFIVSTKSSVRETGINFAMGKTTVYDYMTEKLPRISISLYKQVFDVFMENKSFGINNKDIINQVLTCYELLKAGYSSIDIQNKLGLGRNVVQRNLTTRLKQIDEEKYKEAEEILKRNQMAALEEHSFKPKK